MGRSRRYCDGDRRAGLLDAESASPDPGDSPARTRGRRPCTWWWIARGQSLWRGRVESTPARLHASAHVAQGTPGVDEASGEIVAAVVTTNNYSDSQVLPDLLDQVDEVIEQVSAMGLRPANCYAASGPVRRGRPFPPTQCQDLAAWQHQGPALGARSEPAPDRQVGRAREAGERVSSAQLGGDDDVSPQNDF